MSSLLTGMDQPQQLHIVAQDARRNRNPVVLHRELLQAKGSEGLITQGIHPPRSGPIELLAKLGLRSGGIWVG
jgi:hypothetical protein